MNIPIITAEVRSVHDVPLARQRASQIASLLGFDMHDQTRIATAVSEIARNAVQHAERGVVEFHLDTGTPQALQIVIKDEGPGIANVQELLGVGRSVVSTQGSSLRGVRRLMDGFLIETSAQKGTRVTLAKFLPRTLPRVGPREIGHITQELVQRVAEDPLSMMQQQNQELLHTLDELRAQQEERSAHLREIEILNHRLRRAMTETHHRVKNNLQTITSLIEFQTRGGQDMVPISDVARLGQSIQTLGIIHDILTQESKQEGEVSIISARQVLSRLLSLMEGPLEPRRLLIQLDDVSLPGQQVTSLALITNELVSNAIKHGKGDIEISLILEGDRAIFTVCDDGPGFRKDFDPAVAANTGLELIESIAHYDLRGETFYGMRDQGGARVVLKFPTIL